MIYAYPCDMGDPSNWNARGAHRYSANAVGIVVCELCGQWPPPRPMPQTKRFGLMHPTWARPDCFLSDTAEEARASAERTYGAESGHYVVEIVAVEGGEEV